MPWHLIVALDGASDVSLFVRIARALSDDVVAGRLGPGDRLPGTRSLALQLGVHRNTVLAAYRELAAQGWVRTRPGGGTYVADSPPAHEGQRATRTRVQRLRAPSRVGFDLGDLPPAHPAWKPLERGVLSLAGGVPDPRLQPRTAIARAYRRAVLGKGRLLHCADPRGCEGLRVALADMLAAVRGLTVAPSRVLVTQGSQMALDLVARSLIAPGDVVAVEALGHRPVWEAFRLAGARVVPLPLDAGGLRIDALHALLDEQPIRALYTTPHQYPTTAVLPPERRIEILQLAERHRFAVIEDDYDHEFYYQGHPILPLASQDDAGVVIYVGTLTKLLAPGLRIGYVVAPEPLMEHLARRRVFIDGMGNNALEQAVAELLEDGDVQRHMRRARLEYWKRRDVLCTALSASLGDVLQFAVPARGIAVWARASRGIDVDAWQQRAIAGRVLFDTARRFAFDGRSRPCMRLDFAALDVDELRVAVKRLAAAL